MCTLWVLHCMLCFVSIILAFIYSLCILRRPSSKPSREETTGFTQTLFAICRHLCALECRVTFSCVCPGESTCTFLHREGRAMCVSFVRMFRVAITHQCLISHMAELSCTCDFSVCGPFRSEPLWKKKTPGAGAGAGAPC